MSGYTEIDGSAITKWAIEPVSRPPNLPGFRGGSWILWLSGTLALQIEGLVREGIFEHFQRHTHSMFVALLAIFRLSSYYNTIVSAFIAKHSFLNKTVFPWDIFGLLSSLVVLD